MHHVAGRHRNPAVLGPYLQPARPVHPGRDVVVTMPGTEVISGTAAGVDWAGRLDVRTEHGRVSVTAGDVVHVRPHDPGR